ncbi:hypothetical protein [Halomonas ramblicola]
MFGAVRAWIEGTFSGYYLVTVMLLAVCAFIVVSRYGGVRLGA